MHSPQSVDTLEELGRVRLSPSFFMRDFLYSEISNIHGIPNIPVDPDRAIRNGRALCVQLLEPLQATFGRIAVRSGYRSPTLNQFGNEKKYRCGSNENNFAAHIWDYPDAHGDGAMASVVVPWFTDRFDAGADWRAMAYWIHNHLPYSQLQFFPKLCAFNIGWHEKPVRAITSYIKPAAELEKGAPPMPELASFYAGFPEFKAAHSV